MTNTTFDGKHLFFIKAVINAPVSLEGKRVRVELFVGKNDLYGCSWNPGEVDADCDSFSNGEGQKYNALWIPFKSSLTGGNTIQMDAWRKYE